MQRLESTIHMGAHAEAQFISYALESGWEVAHPFLRGAPYDSLIRRDPNEPWETVQIKRAYHITKSKGGKGLEVRLRRGAAVNPKRRFYRDGDFDWLFCYHEDGRWLLPWGMLKRRSSIQISSKRYDLWKV